MKKKLISVIISVYNEENIVKRLTDALELMASSVFYDFEYIFINDGSCDHSLETLLELAKNNQRIKIIDLSRNFGHQLAITAGIDYAKGDAVVLMDADMEDNPQDILKFLKKWEDGFDVAYAIRAKRRTGLARKICFALFHYLNRLLSGIPVEAAGIFGLMDKKVVEEMKLLKEEGRYIPGLRSWVGFRQIGIELERGGRYDQRPRVHFGKLLTLALNSYFSFSKKPLKLASLLGIFLSFLSFLSAILILLFQLFMKFKVPGWASLVVIVLFIGGVQFICLGIMSEYLGRIFDEVRGRPLYIVRKAYGINV